MSKEIFDEDSDGVFDDEIVEVEDVKEKSKLDNIFKVNREPTAAECIEVIERKKGRPLGSLNKNHEYKRKKLEKEEAVKKLWKLGKLHWKLDGLQKELYNHYHSVT